MPRTRPYTAFAPALAAAALLALTACDNDVELLGDDPAVPVVFGAFNSVDDLQTVSVTKTFRFAEGAGAREAAMTPDSVYFAVEDLAVIATNLSTGATTTAERFDASAEGIARAPGAFPTAPNFAYRYDAEVLELEPGDSLELRLERSGADPALVRLPVLPELGYVRSREPPERYALTAENEFTTNWRVDVDEPEDADALSLFEVGFNFAYLETDAAGATRAKTLYWPAATNRTATGDSRPRSTASIDMSVLFDVLLGELDSIPGGSRRFRYLQIVITGGDQSFVDYLDLLRANTGITSTQELPPFSNVENALGLYASITQLSQDTFATLSPASFDMLFTDDELAPLNFRP